MEHKMMQSPTLPDLWYCAACLRTEIRADGRALIVLNPGDDRAHISDDPRLAPFAEFINTLDLPK